MLSPVELRARSRAALGLLRREGFLAGAVVVGAILRLWQLAGQVPVGDEWYGLRAATTFPLADLFTHLRQVDYSIPIALYLRLAAATVGLTDLTVRAPFVLCGLVAVLVCPLLVRREVGRTTGAVFAWLLATNPFLIAYSRFARPYGITVAAAFVAVIAFERWWAGGGLRPAVAYVVLALLAGALHPVTVVFVLAPVLVALLRSITGSARSGLRRSTRPLLLGTAVALPLLALLAPSLIANPQQTVGRLNESAPTASSWARSFTLLVGPGPTLLAVAMAALAILGCFTLLRQRSTLVMTLAASSSCLLIVLVALHPGHVAYPLQGARYLSPILPLLLLLVAAGTVRAAAAAARLGRALPTLVPVLLVGVVVATGPLPAACFWPNDWMVSWLFGPIGPGDASTGRPPPGTPAFYRALAAVPPGRLRLVEAPFFIPISGNLMPNYQWLHRQHTLVGFTQGLCGGWDRFEVPLDGRVRLSSIVSLTAPEPLRARGVDLVVVHRDLQKELRLNAAQRRALRRMDRSVEGCVIALESWFGAPVWDGGGVVVFSVSGFRPPSSPVVAATNRSSRQASVTP